jgi:hypothetical protein
MIVIINNVQGANGSAIGKTVTHKIQRPSQVGLHWHLKCQCSPGCQLFLGFSVQIQRQTTVNSSNALVIPAMSLISQVVSHLSATPARLFFYQLPQFLFNFVIISFTGLIAIGAAIQIYYSTGLPFDQFVFGDCVLDQISQLF